MAENYSYRVDVFKDFARNKSEFLRKLLRGNSHARRWLKANGYDISKINESMIEVNKGREGNWNDYVREFERIKPKRGENWYEFRLIVDRIPKRGNANG